MGLMKYIGEQFHKPTGWGGKLMTFVMNRQNDGQYRAAEAALDLQETDTVLDIGFGNGYLLHRLAENHNCRFYGIDISEDMLHAASKRCRRFVADGRMTLSLGDALRSRLPDSFFDKAYTVNTVYFWGNLTAGFTEIRRILKPGGVFINAVYTKEFLDTLPVTKQGYAKHSIKHLVEAGEAASFTVSPQVIAEGKAYCIVYQKQGENK
jgi:ubiquinone/menaquinone biosynthesis C-methylase UbiE